MFSELFGIKILEIWSKFYGRVAKAAFYVSRCTFLGKDFCLFFEPFFDPQGKKWDFRKRFSSKLKKFTLGVRGMDCRKNKPFCKQLHFPVLFGFRAVETFWFRCRILARLFKTHSTCPVDQCPEIIKFYTISTCLSFWDIEREWISTFVERCSAKFTKQHSTSSQKHFQANIFFGKK